MEEYKLKLCTTILWHYFVPENVTYKNLFILKQFRHYEHYEHLKKNLFLLLYIQVNMVQITIEDEITY